MCVSYGGDVDTKYTPTANAVGVLSLVEGLTRSSGSAEGIARGATREAEQPFFVDHNSPRCDEVVQHLRHVVGPRHTRRVGELVGGGRAGVGGVGGAYPRG